MNKFIVGLGFGGDREYTINGVKYIVGARFEKQGSSLNHRIGRCIESNIIHLPIEPEPSTIEAENVCSAAGEED